MIAGWWAAIRALAGRVPRRAWLAGGALLLALLIGGGIYRAGVKAERARWQLVVTKAEAARQLAEARWQDQLRDASAALAAAQALAADRSEKVTHEIREYYRDRPAAAGVECLPAERVRAASAARAAILAAAAGE